MKTQIVALTLTFISALASAHPGSNKLLCTSARNSGSSQKLTVKLHRSNGKGYYPPAISITLNQKQFVLPTPNDMSTYGETFHHSPLGVVIVTAENWSEPISGITGEFSVIAMPGTVRAFDPDGKTVPWKLEDEKDECNDSNGKAKFQGLFKGHLNNNSSQVPLDPQIMDCELTYDSGMAC